MCVLLHVSIRVCQRISMSREHVEPHCGDHAVFDAVVSAAPQIKPTDVCIWPPRVPVSATAAAVLLQTPLFSPNIRFLQYSLSLHPPPAPPSKPLPHLVYIITSFWSAAAPHRHCHGNSCTTAGWLPLLPGGVASHPHTLLLCSHSSWRSPVPLLNP